MTEQKDRHLFLRIGDHFSQVSSRFASVGVANHQLGHLIENAAWQESEGDVSDRVAFCLESGEESSGFGTGVTDEDFNA
jgi:hypothetical protein